jgi:protoheme IX farnesyltransferase
MTGSGDGGPCGKPSLPMVAVAAGGSPAVFDKGWLVVIRQGRSTLMNIDTIPLSNARDRLQRGMIRDFIELAKPRISVMVLLTVAVAGFISFGQSTSPDEVNPGMTLVNAMIGLLFVSASGCAVNQYVERYVDWLMPRTADRPLPGQRLSAGQVALFGAVTAGVGIAWLWTLVNWQTMAVAASSWVLYVCIYTPMKPRTWLNTFVGAVAGALPVLVGSTAVTGGQITFAASMLFAVLYIWQFPHFMAISWLYRDDYRRGQLRMASTETHAETLTGRVAVIFALALLPVMAISLWPAGILQGFLFSGALALGVWYLLASWQFANAVDDQTARYLFRVSLVYLPLYLVALTVSAWFAGVTG